MRIFCRITSGIIVAIVRGGECRGKGVESGCKECRGGDRLCCGGGGGEAVVDYFEEADATAAVRWVGSSGEEEGVGVQRLDTVLCG